MKKIQIAEYELVKIPSPGASCIHVNFGLGIGTDNGLASWVPEQYEMMKQSQVDEIAISAVREVAKKYHGFALLLRRGTLTLWACTNDNMLSRHSGPVFAEPEKRKRVTQIITVYSDGTTECKSPESN